MNNLTFNELPKAISQLCEDMAFIKRQLERLQPAHHDELYTDAEAKKYLKCSSVFLWKKRKEGKIKAVNAGKKLLYPKSVLDNYLQLKRKRS